MRMGCVATCKDTVAISRHRYARNQEEYSDTGLIIPPCREWMYDETFIYCTVMYQFMPRYIISNESIHITLNLNFWISDRGRRPVINKLSNSINGAADRGDFCAMSLKRDCGTIWRKMRSWRRILFSSRQYRGSEVLCQLQRQRRKRAASRNTLSVYGVT